MVKTTRSQREALRRVFQRNDVKPEHELNRKAWRQRYKAFHKTVQPGGDCIMVPWCGMWLGIERDGYTHS